MKNEKNDNSKNIIEKVFERLNAPDCNLLEARKWMNEVSWTRFPYREWKIADNILRNRTLARETVMKKIIAALKQNIPVDIDNQHFFGIAVFINNSHIGTINQRMFNHLKRFHKIN